MKIKEKNINMKNIKVLIICKARYVEKGDSDSHVLTKLANLLVNSSNLKQGACRNGTLIPDDKYIMLCTYNNGVLVSKVLTV